MLPRAAPGHELRRLRFRILRLCKLRDIYTFEPVDPRNELNPSQSSDTTAYLREIPEPTPKTLQQHDASITFPSHSQRSSELQTLPPQTHRPIDASTVEDTVDLKMLVRSTATGSPALPWKRASDNKRKLKLRLAALSSHSSRPLWLVQVGFLQVPGERSIGERLNLQQLTRTSISSLSIRRMHLHGTERASKLDS